MVIEVGSPSDSGARAVLADVESLLMALPPGLSGLGPTMARINRALGSLAG